MYTHKHTYTDTHIHTYIHTYIHMHTYISQVKTNYVQRVKDNFSVGTELSVDIANGMRLRAAVVESGRH